ncbi:ROK family protein [Sphingobium sp. SCG-1]|uniref:ROK family protein n=1 Tax=Sphingobium sp. SCG-1 TaxID=2072936 RepID=UPI002691542B|nr:ROK family protein [Sphingobium sp. SCG-1]
MGSTPKPGWSGIDVYQHFASRFDVPVGIDTDVAGAALAEEEWGASSGCTVHCYATVGTGVGLGIVVDGKAVHGSLHPEAGHIRIRRQPGDAFPGACPFHSDCLEGLVGGPALAARASVALADIADDHPLWDQVAADLAEWTAMLVLTLSPQRMVFGGGVIQSRPAIIPKIRARVATILNGYLEGCSAEELKDRIIPSQLGSDIGPLGAVILGIRVIDKSG